MKQKRLNLKGQSMFEVVLALFIITMITVAVVLLSTKSISNSLFSRSKTQASRYSQEAIEWLRDQRETNLDTFSTYTTTPIYCLNSNPPSFANSGACSSAELIPNTIYKRQVTFETSTISAGITIIAATVVTSWEDSKGYHEVRAVTEFNDIRQE
ncbi:MAG: hypothetical protein WA152_03500 [Microgenomates group bacterium]